jgi:hypothetical protein
MENEKLIEITEKNGSIWCQIFHKQTGKIISSFISDSETEAMQKAIAFLNESHQNRKDIISGYDVQARIRQYDILPLAGSYEEVASEIRNFNSAFWSNPHTNWMENIDCQPSEYIDNFFKECIFLVEYKR